MTLVGASPVLDISITLLIILFVVISALMILVVMMQRPKQEGLGAAFGGGMTDQLLGAGTTSFLQKATVVLGILFFVIALVLGILVGRSNKQQGLTAPPVIATEEVAAPDIPVNDEAPAVEETPAEEPDALLDALEATGDVTEENSEGSGGEEIPVISPTVIDEAIQATTSEVATEVDSSASSIEPVSIEDAVEVIEDAVEKSE